MNGLEKLTLKIKDGATAQADEIINDANAGAEKIIAEATKEADAVCAKIAEDSSAARQRILNGASSQGNLDGRKNLLASKRKVIDAAFAKAGKNLLALPDGEYFDFILNIIKKIYNGGDAQIVFNKTDIARIPASFTATLAEISGGKITICTDAGDFDGGFILKYEFLEENCTFDALLRQGRETLEDAVAKILFA